MAKNSDAEHNDNFLEQNETIKKIQIPLQMMKRYGVQLDALVESTNWTHRRHINSDQILAQYLRITIGISERLRKKMPNFSEMHYGATEAEILDVYGMDCLSGESPMVAFIHGGGWQFGDRSRSAFMGEIFLDNGCTFAAIGYGLSPKYTLDEAVSHVAAAIKHLDSICTTRGSRGLYIIGHSAGAHLLAMALTKLSGCVQRLKGVALISGVYDLLPWSFSSRAKLINLDKDMAVRNSPMMQTESLSSFRSTNFVIIVGEHESPWFIDEGREFYALLLKCGATAHFKQMFGEDHFTIVERLIDPNYELSKYLISLTR